MTLLEILMVIAVLALLAAIFLPALADHGHRSSRIGCVNNLKQVGLSFRLWAGDNGDKYPMRVSTNQGGTMEFVGTGEIFRHFQGMSNELSTPKILFCPNDAKRRCATNFENDFNNSRISYFVGVDALETNATMFLCGDRNITGGIRMRNGLVTLTTNQTVGWTREIHNEKGNILFADGSVQQLSISGLRTALENTGIATNRLAIP
ncbi:MAG TPA: type II secretion system protein [Verrucomicrobiae bacterium]|nr:type II secretion system protein [Verrucomicrobiae bacterium]